MTRDGQPLRGRVLVVGQPADRQPTADALTSLGFVVGEAEAAEAPHLATVLGPEAVVVARGVGAEGILRTLKRADGIGSLPVLVESDDTVGASPRLRAAGADELIPTGSDVELRARVEAAVRSKRLNDREQASRRRLEALVEIARAATSSLMLEEILCIVTEKVAEVITADRCSVVLVEGSPQRAVVVASRETRGVLNLELDLKKYPELRQALQTGEAVVVQDALDDPLMAEVRPLIAPIGVRSILVQPLISQDDVVGALFLRVSRKQAAFGPEELDFARAAGSTIANSVRNARLHGALRRKRDDLESAYVDRYRELTDANERLKEANRIKDEIIAVCSHDLRGPLNVLLGHAKLLSDGKLGRQQQSSVDAIIRQGNKVLSLVESLLDKGRGEATRIT
ncbi:MAG: GAF domain-containing protein, partial [Myxococcales bacterium]